MALAGNPTLEKHIGPIYSFEPMIGRSLSSGDPDTYFFEVKGDWGEGVLEVYAINVDGAHEVVSATLTLPTGEVVEIDCSGRDPWGGYGK